MEATRFKALISGGGLKATKQREKIFSIFLDSPGHQNLAQIYARVVKVNPRIGYTTVYRTLKLLTRLGLATQRKFADGETRYEPTSDGSHHDHLICLHCGAILEFEDKGLETLQNTIAHRFRFKPFHHRMELYGLCSGCTPKRNSKGEKNRG